ncbi:MAG: hypothetical protein IIW76_07010 [Bacteroidales bacterium]|nr:hypothetical protein [Bacteroidales bacterium]
MKRTLLLICTLLCANVLMAQEQLAVLKHNDSTSVFYGQSAFEQAYTAATHGDIITLSDGMFSAPDQIRKGITVRGNGACADTARKSTGTYFMEAFNVRYLGDSLQFSAEGIYFDYFRANQSYDIKLTRCYIDNISSVYGLQATNCIMKGSVDGNSSRNNTYINCVINHNNNYYLPQSVICNNCIISGNDYYNYSFYQYNNCVVRKSGGNDTILNGSLNNSILIGFTGANSPTSSGNVAMSLSDVFENWDGETLSTDLETYVLKSSVSDSIQSLDGTEVGIFGGFMPFDWRPSYSIIKRFNVANRTTADGKLSVDIEVISE